MNIILSLIIACTIALGAPSQPSQPASQPASQVECMEDDPCFDSSTMGNLQAGTPNEQDAYNIIATWDVHPAKDQIVQYVDTLDYLPTSLPLGYFVVGSEQPHTFHIMQWVTLSKA